MESETRHIERIKKKMMVKVEGQDCVMEDMSKVGMKLLVPFLLKKKDIKITFQMKDFFLTLDCHVCWIKKQLNIYQQPEYQVGVYIPSPPAEYIELVENLTSTT